MTSTNTTPAASVTLELTQHAIERFPERKRLIPAFVKGQEFLSSIDRLPNPPSRGDLNVQLSERGEEHARS